MKFLFISVPYMINIQAAKSTLKVIDIFIFVSQVSPWAFKTWINMWNHFPILKTSNVDCVTSYPTEQPKLKITWKQSISLVYMFILVICVIRHLMVAMLLVFTKQQSTPKRNTYFDCRNLWRSQPIHSIQSRPEGLLLHFVHKVSIQKTIESERPHWGYSFPRTVYVYLSYLWEDIQWQEFFCHS